MLTPTINASDFIYATGSKIYQDNLDPEGTNIRLIATATKPMELILITLNDEQHLYDQGSSVNIDAALSGFKRFELHTTNNSHIAYTYWIRSGDALDYTPVALGLPPEDDFLIDQQARQAVAARLRNTGMSEEEINMVLDGPLDDEEDFEFEDDFADPTATAHELADEPPPEPEDEPPHGETKATEETPPDPVKTDPETPAT